MISTDNVNRSTNIVPFLMRQNITADFFLLALDKFDICKHAVFLEACRQLSCKGEDVRSYREQMKYESTCCDSVAVKAG